MASRNNLQNAEVNSAVAAVLTLANPSTSAFMYIWAVDISAAGAATVQFFNGTGALTGVITLATGVPWVTKTDSSIPIFTVDPGTSFKITQGGTTQISGYVEYSN